MDNMSYRNNRPMQQANDRSSAPASQPSTPPASSPVTVAELPKGRSRGTDSKRRRILPLVLILAAVIAIIGVLWFMFGRTSGASVDSSKLQYVKLVNGEEYFGKLRRVGSDYQLSNIFYLKKKNQADSSEKTDAASLSASDFELIKLGNEIHGPEDAMFIDGRQLVYFENLKPSGTVSKTITNYQQKSN